MFQLFDVGELCKTDEGVEFEVLEIIDPLQARVRLIATGEIKYATAKLRPMPLPVGWSGMRLEDEMFGGFGHLKTKRAIDNAKHPRDGWCDCPKEKDELDYAKIASVLGRDKLVCVKCNRLRKMEVTKKADGLGGIEENDERHRSNSS